MNMNKKEELIYKLTELTNSDTIQWKSSSGAELQAYVPNSFAIIRAFRADHFGSQFYLVEQKLPEYFPDLESYYESIRRDVYIFSQGNLEMVINQEEISEIIMSNFIQTVLEKNNNLFLDSLFSKVNEQK